MPQRTEMIFLFNWEVKTVLYFTHAFTGKAFGRSSVGLFLYPHNLHVNKQGWLGQATLSGWPLPSRVWCPCGHRERLDWAGTLSSGWPQSFSIVLLAALANSHMKTQGKVIPSFMGGTEAWKGKVMDHPYQIGKPGFTMQDFYLEDVDKYKNRVPGKMTINSLT